MDPKALVRDTNALRVKLRPVFDKFDADKSGSISTSEMGRVLKAVKMELSKLELEQLMKEADPDGSGEIDFEEFVAALQKQMSDGWSAGGANLAAVVTQLSWQESPVLLLKIEASPNLASAVNLSFLSPTSGDIFCLPPGAYFEQRKAAVESIPFGSPGEQLEVKIVDVVLHLPPLIAKH